MESEPRFKEGDYIIFSSVDHRTKSWDKGDVLLVFDVQFKYEWDELAYYVVTYFDNEEYTDMFPVDFIDTHFELMNDTQMVLYGPKIDNT